MSKAPIGIFDSGAGGLTVLKFLREKMPLQDFIYVGDSARYPYGRKPSQLITQFSSEIVNFLQQQNVSCIVVACYTACTYALPYLKTHAKVPIYGVLDSAVEAALKVTKTKHVGLVGTQGTISAGVFQKQLEENGIKVWAKACPLFVHLVEEGLSQSPEADLIARHYLSNHADFDTLILGCTHYPLLKKSIENAIEAQASAAAKESNKTIGTKIQLVEGSEGIADVLTKVAESPSINASDKSAKMNVSKQEEMGTGQITHYVTGDVQAFSHTAKILGGVEGTLNWLDLSILRPLLP